ncbi:urease accessory protein UreD [Rhodophyticola sp.]|jgi:urease accessory protein|uniref:urease accessory protein UreD n=1 Tax=Rhodophyticola sp. TaxID=2680032 RepID=UPI001B18787D|nr:urease accessory protein UreD [Roseicyclus sp.]MBO6623851.1 urease accessory protein UreD [Roseicyclus sp.]MBO6921133.1 urease accessory protein UreD [Roseicyclus sp.]
MFDATSTATGLQRTRGRARVAMADGRLTHLHQEGAAKAMLPRMHGRWPEVVFLNTSGGITGGDRLDYALDLAPGSRAVGTTQTAERAYRAAGGVGRVRTRLTLGAGAELHWLPQELILFDGAALERDLQVEMAADATLVMLETLVLGRMAMGETLTDLHLRDRRAVRRGGRLVLLEPVRMDAADLMRPGTAGLNGARALASLSLIAPDAVDRLAGLRRVLPADGVRAAASVWGGRLTARLVSADAFALRRCVARAVTFLTRQPLPRVWQI